MPETASNGSIHIWPEGTTFGGGPSNYFMKSPQQFTNEARRRTLEFISGDKKPLLT